MKTVNIVVAGVGGAGSNMLERTLEINGISSKIKSIVLNTDSQALSGAKAEKKIQIGEKLTRGLGAGMKPEIGEKAALESEDEIREEITGADLLIVVAGLGGGTGTGASPLVAELARSMGILTVSIVVKPFSFEGRKRMKLANSGFDKLVSVSDSVITIYNENLLGMVDKNIGIKEAFSMVDSILSKAIEGIVGVIVDNAVNSVNLDFSDFQTIMKHNGLSLMGNATVGMESDNALGVMKEAVSSPLLGRKDISGAKGIIVHFKNHSNYPLVDIAEAMEFIEESVEDDADIIFGTTNYDDMPEDKIEITVIATGFDYEVTDKKEDTEDKNIIKTKKDLFSNKMRTPLNLTTEEIDIPTFLREKSTLSA